MFYEIYIFSKLKGFINPERKNREERFFAYFRKFSTVQKIAALYFCTPPGSFRVTVIFGFEAGTGRE
ncbi:MAG: hypothetical protein BWK80_14210 [Desulfobacteraceae bacterium IS3]|nr:MAG: hypothetical protein BWK80_14210 [Desulfobacteraceae bacterium IS3]